MRRAHPLTGILAVLALASLTGCADPAPEPRQDRSGEKEKKASDLHGLALVHLGHDGGDPVKEQALVFHDPASGAETAVLALPDFAIDPVSPVISVHDSFSADWRFFAYADPEKQLVHLARLNDDGSGYTKPVVLEPPDGVNWGRPRIHGDRLWFSTQTGGEGGPAKAVSVPLDDPKSKPEPAGDLALNEIGQPGVWAIDPDGALHSPTEESGGRVGDAANGVNFQLSGKHLMSARMTKDRTNFQHFDASPVWGGDTILVGLAGFGPDSRGGALHRVTVDPEAGTSTDALVFEESGGAVRQYAPAPDRRKLMVQTDKAWYEAEAGNDTGKGTKRFAVPEDGSADGYPHVVGWF